MLVCTKIVTTNPTKVLRGFRKKLLLQYNMITLSHLPITKTMKFSIGSIKRLTL